MVKLINIEEIKSISNETFILDTNIWLYIFSNYNTNDFGYSNILNLLLENQCNILLPPLISTEFVNRYCRQAFEIYKANQQKFSYKKDFRPSMYYSAAFSYIIGVINEDIQPITTFIPLEETDINSALTKPCLADLNDDIILNVALRTKSILVTHDRDYLKSNKNVKLVQL
ncbi:hypothetical protein Q9Q_02851 [Enterococcus faecalis EnGen0078]|uniref:hypothetical protein n=2 Tax=Enterococcus faecalis TaxID=1351 RepID=UPI000330E59F|nr:hypothetical protein [Enterococcus faecalis]EOE05036.1 hypothetical protein Q9Q_02851 [Enterococcus faecalis EnGen0078]EOK32122.1 hypothetical protein WU9_00941 [Enterococcus faecalis EnGen0334]NSN29567.1 hypothetical protein [Enterococcus faecalis]